MVKNIIAAIAGLIALSVGVYAIGHVNTTLGT